MASQTPTREEHVALILHSKQEEIERLKAILVRKDQDIKTLQMQLEDLESIQSTNLSFVGGRREEQKMHVASLQSQVSQLSHAVEEMNLQIETLQLAKRDQQRLASESRKTMGEIVEVSNRFCRQVLALLPEGLFPAHITQLRHTSGKKDIVFCIFSELKTSCEGDSTLRQRLYGQHGDNSHEQVRERLNGCEFDPEVSEAIRLILQRVLIQVIVECKFAAPWTLEADAKVWFHRDRRGTLQLDLHRHGVHKGFDLVAQAIKRVMHLPKESGGDPHLSFATANALMHVFTKMRSGEAKRQEDAIREGVACALLATVEEAAGKAQER